MSTVAIIQARTGATRLPDKVTRSLAGKSVLERVVERVNRAWLDKVVVATSINKNDAEVADICKDRGYECFRGNEEDVLDRYSQAAKFYAADDIVRITADCPLIDPLVIKMVVAKHLSSGADYTSNLLPRTYPRGLDVEVIKFSTLEKEWQEVIEGRQHVTLNIRQNPKSYRVANEVNGFDYSHMRWTLDTQEDLAFLRKVYDYFGDDVFGWRDVLNLLDKHKDWVLMDKDPILESKDYKDIL